MKKLITLGFLCFVMAAVSAFAAAPTTLSFTRYTAVGVTNAPITCTVNAVHWNSDQRLLPSSLRSFALSATQTNYSTALATDGSQFHVKCVNTNTGAAAQAKMWIDRATTYFRHVTDEILKFY